MAEAIWESTVRRRLDGSRSELGQQEQEQFKNWLRDPPDTPIERWSNYEEVYSSLDLTEILGRGEYCHDFVRDALRYYLHHIVHCDEHTKHFEENSFGLAQLINLVYYAEKRTASGEGILNEVIEAVVSTLSKFPRWVKVDVLSKVICTGCPVYVAVRLFNGFDSPSDLLPRSLLQSAAFTKDHFYLAPSKEGFSVATRVMGWGSNRLSNLGCHEGSSVDQRSMVTLPRFGGSRVTAFSVGVNHSLFLTENRQLFVTGRLKNWTGRSDDERIALTPVRVDLPGQAESDFHVERFNSFTSLPNLQCRRLYAGANRSEILFSTDHPLVAIDREWDLIRVVAGPGLKGSSKEPSAMKNDERLTIAEPSHMISNDGYNLHVLDPIPPIRFKGSKKHKLDLEITMDARGGLLVSDSPKVLPRELRVCLGNIVHRPHAIRQSAFCDNGDVYCLLQVDRMARNFTLVKGEIRRLRVDQMEWKSTKTSKEKKDEQYFLVAEEVAGAEHVVQFSVDRNGDNLLFETRDQPRAQSFHPVQTYFHAPLNAHEDPEMCYGGATRSLELLQRERDCGNVMVDEEQLIKLYPHSNFLCPRTFLSDDMMEDLKEESPIEKRSMERGTKGVSGSHKFFIELHDSSRRGKELDLNKKSAPIPLDNTIVPIPDRYYGASFENGSLQVCIPRQSLPQIDMRTKQYADRHPQLVISMIECYIRDLFPFQSPVRVCITGRSEAYTYVTLRPAARLRGLNMLRVTYNGVHEYEIAENLWELHTPHFSRSLFHSSAMTPVVECPFPESVMRLCERAFIDPSSTENYTTIQLLNMLDVADYVCANLLAQDVIYRLIRNATRADINEILGEIVQTLNSRSSLVSVLSRFPHILLDWPIDLDADLLYEACEAMQQYVGPVPRVLERDGSAPIPSHCNLSLFILASPNCELAVRPNELPLSNEPNKETAIANIFNGLPGEDTLLNLVDIEDRLSLLFDSFKGDKGMVEKCKRLFHQCNARFAQTGQEVTIQYLQQRISTDLEQFLTTIPSPEAIPSPAPKEKPSKRTRRHTERRSERDEQNMMEVKREEKLEEVEVKRVEEELKEITVHDEPSTSMGIRKEEGESRLPTLSFSQILKQEEEMEAANKLSTPKRGECREGGKRSKFRPLSFSDSTGSRTPSKNVDMKHDWTQSPRVETPKEKQAKSFTQIMKEQSERKSGVSRRRGPSVSGCQMEAEAAEALALHYRATVEDHQLVSVEVCRHEEEAPRWNADADLYLD